MYFLHQIAILSLIIKMYLELFFQYKHFLKKILYAHCDTELENVSQVNVDE